MTQCYQFPSIGSLGKWADAWEGFLDNDRTLPIVKKDGLYFYFAQNTLLGTSKDYLLVMTSTKNLMEKL